MILKIERYYGPADEDPNCWWMLDDIRKISHYVYKNVPSAENLEELDADITLLDYEDYMEKMGHGQSHREVIKLLCRLSNDKEFLILFDTIAYILNDNGKTIEKLVANYR